MINQYFSDELVTDNDLYFLCYMIERVARKIKQHNKYVVNQIGEKNLRHLICVAGALHCENPLAVEERWIEEYNLQQGSFNIKDVNSELVDDIPTPTQIGKVYQRLICNTLSPDEDYIDGLMRVYNNEICDTIDNYNCSAYYEPSYYLARAYTNGF